jgi:small subunit ribosomal protein S5
MEKRRGSGNRRRNYERREEEKIWFPKTKLGKSVLAGKFESLDTLLKEGHVILEPEIVDHLEPEMNQEVIYIGGSPGKGGGIRRTATKRTTRMHKSGRRFKLTALVAVGNGRGIIGIGKASSKEHRMALEKAAQQAKLNVIRVRSACGSWECACDGEHSIPFSTRASFGSVKVRIIPGPKGLGIVANPTVKKIIGLAGIKDIWVKTSGKTETRINLTYAVFDALRNLNRTKGAL